MEALNDTPQGLCLEQVSLTALAAEFGTPAYVYSRAMIENRWRAMDAAFSGVAHRICYAVKACPNIAILSLLARMNSGFEVVSGGELYRVIKAGGNPAQIMFSGVGKTEHEIEQALHAGIYCLNIESPAEFAMIERIAKRIGTVAPVALRVNPDIDADTHAYITTGCNDNKFGIAMDEAVPLYRQAADSDVLKPVGIGCHIGSQITDLHPLAQSAHKITALAEQMTQEHLPLHHINLGGGLGIAYGGNAPTATEYVQTLLRVVGETPWEILIEPGRGIVGDAGLLLTRVNYLKHHAGKHFAIVDAAMNDLLRPALYQAEHPIQTVTTNAAEKHQWDIVGPVCESGDYLAKQRSIALAAGDLIAVLAAGAYGFSMASQYNSRPRVPEILVDGEHAHLIRRRETPEDLIAAECVPSL